MRLHRDLEDVEQVRDRIQLRREMARPVERSGRRGGLVEGTEDSLGLASQGAAAHEHGHAGFV